MPGHHFDQFSQRHIPVALRMKSRFVQIAWPESPQEPQVVMAVQSVNRDKFGRSSFHVTEIPGSVVLINRSNERYFISQILSLEVYEYNFYYLLMIEYVTDGLHI